MLSLKHFGVLTLLSITLLLSAQDVKAQTSCTDTDNGVTFGASGTVYGVDWSGTPYSYIDYCVDSDRLIENYCSGTNPQRFGYNCSSLGAGYTCQNNKCAKPSICKDSDNGNYPYIPGYTTVDGVTSCLDSCTNSYSLKECTCSTNSTSSTVGMTCTFGCSVNKCKNAPTPTPTTASTCFDSDYGFTLTKYGTTTGKYSSGASYSFSDYCYTSTEVREQACSGTTPISRAFDCSSSQRCSGGACIPR